MLAVADLAQAVRAASLGPPVSDHLSSGLAIHRANHFHGLSAALAVAFPVTRQIVGEAFFDAMAQFYISQNPPRSRIIAQYGDTLGDFIADFPPAGEVPYLADVARLEYRRIAAYHAADARPLSLGDAGGLEGVLQRRFTLAPATSIVASTYPIQSIWLANRPGEDPVVDDWSPETVLVTRRAGHVTHTRLDAFDLALIGAIEQCSALADALDAVGPDGLETRAAEAFARLVAADALVSIDPQ